MHVEADHGQQLQVPSEPTLQLYVVAMHVEADHGQQLNVAERFGEKMSSNLTFGGEWWDDEAFEQYPTWNDALDDECNFFAHGSAKNSRPILVAMHVDADHGQQLSLWAKTK